MKKVKDVIKSIIRGIKNLTPSPLVNFLIINNWKRKGMPAPPSHHIKQKVIIKYQETSNINVFVETGTYLGEMVYALKNYFKKIYSVELGYDLWKSAALKFNKYKHIALIHGDSSEKMSEILSKIDEPAIFWLDGHYSAGITAKGEKNCPIYEELGEILKSKYKNIILIDDARCFVGKDDYPTIEELQSYIHQLKSSHNFEVKNDIIRIVPKEYAVDYIL